jgi:hypothetical protein
LTHHGKDERLKESLEGFMSHNLAVILNKLAGCIESGKELSSDRDVDTLLDEAESLYRRTFDIYLKHYNKAKKSENPLDPLTPLTGLMLYRQKYTPELKGLLEREIALARDLGDNARLSDAISKMSRYCTEQLRRFESIISFGDDSNRTGSANDFNIKDYEAVAEQLFSMTNELIQLHRGLGFGDDDEQIKNLKAYLEVNPR